MDNLARAEDPINGRYVTFREFDHYKIGVENRLASIEAKQYINIALVALTLAAAIAGLIRSFYP